VIFQNTRYPTFLVTEARANSLDRTRVARMVTTGSQRPPSGAPLTPPAGAVTMHVGNDVVSASSGLRADQLTAEIGADAARRSGH
jgi:hypothetical protein